MDETTRLTLYYKKLNIIEQRLINANESGDMLQVLMLQADKITTWDAIRGLESQGFIPNT